LAGFSVRGNEYFNFKLHEENKALSLPGYAQFDRVIPPPAAGFRRRTEDDAAGPKRPDAATAAYESIN
jgi:hypothetical protein